jgi:DNA-binding transcriptional regulator LsrR (DeoR family)
VIVGLGLGVLERVASRISPGRAPIYSAVHVLKALEIMGSSEGVGRQELARLMGLGEGVVRTLVRHLRSEGLLEVSRRGMRLSFRGSQILMSIMSIMSSMELSETEISVGPYSHAVLVKGAVELIRSGIEQRDAAIKVGARGATTLVYRGGRFQMPGVDMEVPEEIRVRLLEGLDVEDGDVIIIGAGDTPLSAEIGAKAAALDLLRHMKSSH